MNRWSILSIGTLLLSAALAAGAQEAPLFSSDLVAWSGMQQPTAPEQKQKRQPPTPEPAPETQPSQNPTASPNAGHSSATSAASDQTPTVATFTGTIAKDPDGFTLKVSDTTSYKLDNERQVQQYVGQHVKVTGTLDPASNLIHVNQVEPLS